jgi:hypothetical protein
MLGIMHTKIFIALLLLSLRVEASSLDLTNWVGKYPIGNDKRFQIFFEAPEVNKALKKMLSPSQWKRLTDTYALATPIQLIQDHVVVACCKPHCCPCEHAMLVVDLRRERFHVGFYRGYYQDKTTIEWISSDGEFYDLPKAIQEEFYYGHNAK